MEHTVVAPSKALKARVRSQKFWDALRQWWIRLAVAPVRGVRNSSLRGLERRVCYVLVWLRRTSLHYAIVECFPADGRQQRKRRDFVVEFLVICQFAITIVAVWIPDAWLRAAVGATAYLLFVLYLSLLNILFLTNVPAVNAPTTSVSRSLLLLFINLLQVVIGCSVFYRSALGLCPWQAIFGAFLVLGTLGRPDNPSASHTLLVPLQVLLDVVLLVFVVSIFAGRFPLRLQERKRRRAERRGNYRQDRRLARIVSSSR